MEAEIIKTAASQGFFAVLFVALLFYVINKQDKREQKNDDREKRLMETLEKAQSNNLQLAHAVQKLSERVEDIDKKIDKWGVKGG